MRSLHNQLPIKDLTTEELDAIYSRAVHQIGLLLLDCGWDAGDATDEITTALIRTRRSDPDMTAQAWFEAACRHVGVNPKDCAGI